MLIDFAITNYKSIKGTVHLNMVFDTKKSNEELDKIYNHDNRIDFFKVPADNSGRVNICPVMALLGANASGKSNILKAFLTLRAIVLNGYIENFYTPFKFSSETENAPAKFEVTFSNDSETNPCIYTYGIEYSAHRIEQEYLKIADTIVYDTNDFDTIPKDMWQLFVTRHKPILKVALEVETEEKTDSFSRAINDANDFFQKLFIADDINLAPISDDIRVKHTVKNWLFRMDMKFCDIDMNHDNAQKKIVPLYPDEHVHKDPTIHEIRDKKLKLEQENPNSLVTFLLENANPIFKLYDISMKYAKDCFSKKEGHTNTVSLNYILDESTGTKNLFRFLFVLIDALQHGKIIIFDEIDRTIHTELLNFLFDIIQATNLNNSGGDKYGAQMICSSHNPYIIKTAKHHGTMFVEKWVDLSTNIRLLSKYYDTDTDVDIVIKDYLNGLLGGTPRIIDIFETMEIPNA